MPGASLSRWTLTYFACALACLVAAEGLMVMGFGYPGAAIDAPETLILVHLAAIGWLSLLMCGALFQFVPVLVAQPLLGDGLPPVALAFILLGLAVLLSGFAGMAGFVAVPAEAMPLGGLLLGIGFGAASPAASPSSPISMSRVEKSCCWPAWRSAAVAAAPGGPSNPVGDSAWSPRLSSSIRRSPAAICKWWKAMSGSLRSPRGTMALVATSPGSLDGKRVHCRPRMW